MNLREGLGLLNNLIPKEIYLCDTICDSVQCEPVAHSFFNPHGLEPQLPEEPTPEAHEANVKADTARRDKRDRFLTFFIIFIFQMAL